MRFGVALLDAYLEFLAVRGSSGLAPACRPCLPLPTSGTGAAPPQHGWLFPGGNSGQPITHRTLVFKLRNFDFAVGQARISALRQLVLQAPAPVIAAALGVHHSKTTRQANNAGTT
ncbi:hypothetical protein [Actinoplanes sp. NPDC089786]|uniref:hypothetical protein n=1 Tax=Actinoplanes sp. NPDC089786 TaxID=3155185 RepID=UPI0034343EC1